MAAVRLRCNSFSCLIFHPRDVPENQCFSDGPYQPYRTPAIGAWHPRPHIQIHCHLKLKGTPEFTTCNHLHISNIRAQAEMFGYHLGFSKMKSFMFVFFTSMLLLLEPTSPVQLAPWQAWNCCAETCPPCWRKLVLGPNLFSRIAPWVKSPFKIYFEGNLGLMLHNSII